MLKLKLPDILLRPLTAFQVFSHSATLRHYLLTGLLYYPGETISRFCVQPTYGAQEYQICTDTAISGYQFTPWLSDASRGFISCAKRSPI